MPGISTAVTESARQPVLMRDAAPAARPAATPDRASAFLAPSDLAAMSGAWADLAAHASGRNPFFAPFMLQPALAHLTARNVSAACVWSGGELIGLLPVAPALGYARLPIRHLATWMHPHCFFGEPLVRRGAEQEFFERLFALTDKHPSHPAFLRLAHLDAKGPLIAAAESAAEGRVAYRSGAYERALLTGGYRAEAYLEATVRKKKRKEMNRLRNRLAELGPVALRTLSSRSEIDSWCAAFLTLEAAGWKGKEGSALGSVDSDAAFFREAVQGAYEVGALKFFRLDVGERPIAMIVNFILDGEGYSFKIAHDEEFARFSPGVMIEVDMLKALETHEGLKFVDSCARADHPMINSLWTERREIVGLNVSGSGLAGRSALQLCRLLETAKERFGRAARPAPEGEEQEP